MAPDGWDLARARKKAVRRLNAYRLDLYVGLALTGLAAAFTATVLFFGGRAPIEIAAVGAFAIPYAFGAWNFERYPAQIARWASLALCLFGAAMVAQILLGEQSLRWMAIVIVFQLAASLRRDSPESILKGYEEAGGQRADVFDSTNGDPSPSFGPAGAITVVFAIAIIVAAIWSFGDALHPPSSSSGKIRIGGR